MLLNSPCFCDTQKNMFQLNVFFFLTPSLNYFYLVYLSRSRSSVSLPPVFFCFFIGLNVFFFLPVPSAVPIIHQVSRSTQSITLSWPEPEQPNGKVLDYQLRYREKVPATHAPRTH